MAGKFCTAFGVNSLANMVAGGYFDGTVGSGLAAVAANGPFGEATLSYSGNGSIAYLIKNFGVNFSTIYVGFWFRLTSQTIAAVPLVFYDGATPQVYFQIAVGGQISIYRGTPGSGTLLATNVAATLSLNKWTFIEIGVVFNATTGSVELKFNGSDVISLTGSLNTAPSGNAQFSTFQLGCPYSPGGSSQLLTYDITDLYVCDSSGARNNTFLGPGQVLTFFPTSNGTTTQFTGTPNTGANTWQNVDNNPSLAADYNFSNTVGQKDEFNHAATPAAVSSVAFMQASAFWAIDAAGTRTAQLVFLSGATEADLPASPLTVVPGYSWGLAIEEVDPATSAAITPSALSSLQFGYKLVS